MHVISSHSRALAFALAEKCRRLRLQEHLAELLARNSRQHQWQQSGFVNSRAVFDTTGKSGLLHHPLL